MLDLCKSFESLVKNNGQGMQTIVWDNRARPEYETPYDPPAPRIRIHGTLIVAKYAVAFANTDEQTVRVTNSWLISKVK